MRGVGVTTGAPRADGGTRSQGGRVELITVAAVAENGVIGREGELPWTSIPADRRQYRARVADSPVIIGRRTFESMTDDLPGRVRIVLTRRERRSDVGSVRYATDVEEAIALAAAAGGDRAYVLGGAAIYRLFQPRIDRMLLSRIPGRYDGDARFPDWDPDRWTLVDRVDHGEFVLEEWRRDAG